MGTSNSLEKLQKPKFLVLVLKFRFAPSSIWTWNEVLTQILCLLTYPLMLTIFGDTLVIVLAPDRHDKHPDGHENDRGFHIAV